MNIAIPFVVLFIAVLTGFRKDYLSKEYYGGQILSLENIKSFADITRTINNDTIRKVVKCDLECKPVKKYLKKNKDLKEFVGMCLEQKSKRKTFCDSICNQPIEQEVIKWDLKYLFGEDFSY